MCSGTCRPEVFFRRQRHDTFHDDGGRLFIRVMNDLHIEVSRQPLPTGYQRRSWCSSFVLLSLCHLDKDDRAQHIMSFSDPHSPIRDARDRADRMWRALRRAVCPNDPDPKLDYRADNMAWNEFWDAFYDRDAQGEDPAYARDGV